VLQDELNELGLGDVTNRPGREVTVVHVEDFDTPVDGSEGRRLIQRVPPVRARELPLLEEVIGIRDVKG